MPLPGTDSNLAVLLDLFGVSRNILVTGIKTGSLATQNTFITAMEALTAGSQVGVTFVSSHTSFANKTVFVKSFNWEFVKGNLNKINYRLDLVEGATVS